MKSLKEVRDTFRMRTQLVEGFKGNFKNMYKSDSLSCEGCGVEVDTQAHAMICPAYADLRDGKDMGNDSDLVTSSGMCWNEEITKRKKVGPSGGQLSKTRT